MAVVDNSSHAFKRMPNIHEKQIDLADESWALKLLSEFEADESITVDQAFTSVKRRSDKAALEVVSDTLPSEDSVTLPNNKTNLKSKLNPDRQFLLSSDDLIDDKDAVEINANLLELSAIENQILLKAIKQQEMEANPLAKNDSFFALNRIRNFFKR